MKYAIILLSGAADEQAVSLDGRSPLEAAMMPHTDWIATNGRQGTVVTVPKGFHPGSDVATLSLLGYDPKKHHDGRAPWEAAAKGLSAGPGQLIFRCNFVTVVDGVMEDPSAGHITQKEADRLIDELNEQVADDATRFYSGVSYRNLLIATAPPGASPACTPPHDIPGRRIEPHLPKGKGADWLKKIMALAHGLLADHDVNVVRRDMGENPATDIWLWGPGARASLPIFAERFGMRGAVVAAVDVVRGIAKCAGFEVLEVPGATGYVDTDYEAKGAAAVEALDRHDLVVVHIQAPDEAGHLGDVHEKVTAIERVDKFIVGPVLEKARTFDAWRVMVVVDHLTLVDKRVHSAEAPPFCFAGKSVRGTQQKPFSEASARASDLHVEFGCDLMEYFLRG